jgi:hypothetical protein
LNCFTGTLPDDVCDITSVFQLILDGLHSASACSDKALPRIPSSGLIATDTVHGHIPTCLLQHKHLSVLHLGGNSFSGSIPDVPISAAMTELVLSSNQLTGSIPDSIWQSNITKLDLSLNRLQGTLPSDMLPAAQYRLKRSNGNSTVSVKLQVNQLAGTIPGWLQSLPSGDINVLEGNLFSCNPDRSDLPANDPKAATYECGSDNTNYGLIAFGAALVCVSMVVGVYWCYSTGDSKSVSMPALEMLVFFDKYYGESEVKKLWKHVERVVYVIVGMWMLGMIVYGLLSLQFSSYAEVYVWVVSAIYKMGQIPALIIFFWFAVLQSVVIGFLRSMQKLQPSNKRGLLLFKLSSTYQDLNKTQQRYFDMFTGLIFILTNMVVVIVVNGWYVYFSVTTAFSDTFLIAIALLLSLFKIGWNFLLLTVSQYVDAISDNSMTKLCLFNNLLAPLLAEMFVSPQCFLYLVSQAPALVFNYNVFTCQYEHGKHFSGEICSIPILFAQDAGIQQTVSIIPPFHQSFQCSDSLIASYAYVFVFRYLLTGLIEPGLRLILSVRWKSQQWRLVLQQLLPPLWRMAVRMRDSIDDPKKLETQLQWWKSLLESGMFRRRVTVTIGIDISMLICFGGLFPPLAVIIALSILKDVMSIRLALGRYCEIMEAVQDDSLKEQMVKVRESMDEEMLKAGAVIWNGLWYGMVVSSLIWGYILYDTMGSTKGLEKGLCMLIAMILCPYILFNILQITDVVKKALLENKSVRAETLGSKADNLDGSIVNPIIDDFEANQIEMRCSSY